MTLSGFSVFPEHNHGVALRLARSIEYIKAGGSDAGNSADTNARFGLNMSRSTDALQMPAFGASRSLPDDLTKVP